MHVRLPQNALLQKNDTNVSQSMTRRLVVEFTKMQGAGNDFLVIDNRFYRFSDAELVDVATRWCPRRTGIGADGLLALNPPEDEAHDYRMRYLNADGSWATMCANGARCLAAYAVQAGIGAPTVVFATDAGTYRATAAPDTDAVRLWTPPSSDLTLNAALDQPLPADLDAVHTVWTGTEHLVAFVHDPDAVALETLGPRLRHDASLAPEGVNVNVVSCNNGFLTMRTYEKGVEAETLSCGTGVLAAAVLAWATGQTDASPVPVATPGGTFRVERSDDGGLILEGPVAFVFRGTLELDV